MKTYVKNTNEEYHGGEGVSKSDLDLIHVCPEKYRFRKDNPEKRETPALLFGSMAHKLILEPEDFDCEFIVAPDVDRRTKDGREIYDEFLRIAGKRRAVSRIDYETGCAMRKALMTKPKIRQLLSGGETELSYYWNDERTGVLCKCRPDKVNLGYIIDLKTTSDASPEAFARSMYNYRYHVQAAWYLGGVEAVTGERPAGFIFIAVEKEPPFASAVYVVNDITTDIGAKEAAADLDTYVACSESGNWYGYGGEKNDAMTIDLPAWAIRRKENE